MDRVSRKSWSDEELVSACLKGDGQSWDEFVGRFSKLVHWSIRKTLEGSSFKSRKELLEDIFQEFFKKWLDRNELARLRDCRSLKKFIAVSACHMAMDKVKELSRLERRETPITAGMGAEEENPASILMNGCGPSDSGHAAAAHERNQLVESVFLSLSPKERMCVELHYLDGYTHQRIAALLGISQDTVSTVLRRVKEKIRMRLLDKGIADF
jgi:RNA polymerase sigma factor (sigma-70 family)